MTPNFWKRLGRSALMALGNMLFSILTIVIGFALALAWGWLLYHYTVATLIGMAIVLWAYATWRHFNEPKIGGN